MRSTAFVVVLVAGCGHGGLKPMEQACATENADPGACFAVAKERFERHDLDGARTYMDRTVAAADAAQACLRDHSENGCFVGVVALLQSKPVGLLAQYDVPDALLDMVPRWTGSETTGRRAQARDALVGMCSTPGKDPIAQQRACIVLGDLVEDERWKRCGLGCEPEIAEAQMAGWSAKDVLDGYAAACKVDHKATPRAEYAGFVEELERVYKVRAGDAACAIGESTLKGASIPGALESMARIREEARKRELAAARAAQREAERIAAMEKSKLEAKERAAAAEMAVFRKAALEAIGKADWATLFGLLSRRRGSPVDAEVATALYASWDSFARWAIMQSNVVGTYLDLSSRLSLAPKNHAIHVAVAGLADRALVVARKNARNARGKGGAWLHAAIIAKLAGPKSPEVLKASLAYDKLVAATRVSLTIDNLAPACTSLIKPTAPGGRAIRVKSTLQCVVEPEKTYTANEPFKLKQTVVTEDGSKEVEQETTIEVTHRTFKVVVRGALQITRGAPARTIPIEYAAIVDDTDNSDTRKFETERVAAMDMIQKAVVGDLEAAAAEKAHAAGVKALEANRQSAAEDYLITHAVLAGPSPELNQLLSTTYGIVYSEIVPIL